MVSNAKSFHITGYNSTYSLSNALAAVGSNASAGANPLVIMNTLGPFVGSPGPGFKLFVIFR